MADACPLLEFDPQLEAILNPRQVVEPVPEAPACCVLCFFYDVIADLRAKGIAEQVAEFGTEIGLNPIYRVPVGDAAVTLLQPGVGAPLAAFFLDSAIAIGCRWFVACGGAGVLDREIAVGHLIVPNAAIRDEGTSFHYLPPGREVTPDAAALAAVEQTLREHGVGYLLAKTWTTDGFFRETPAKVRRRRAEGCLTVEMEAAALFAVARFRGVALAQLLYGGDDVSGSGDWDHRDWFAHEVRERLFWLAAESCLRLRASAGDAPSSASIGESGEVS